MCSLCKSVTDLDKSNIVDYGTGVHHVRPYSCQIERYAATHSTMREHTDGSEDRMGETPNSVK